VTHTLNAICSAHVSRKLAVLSDVSGRDRIPIKFEMSPVLWDVFSITFHALLHLYIGPVNAWPAVALLCAVCAVDRDLDIHEMVAAVYILRFACSTTRVDGATAYVVCALVTIGSLSAHMPAYATLPHTYRRPVLFALVICAVMLRYPWNTDPIISVLRLIMYTAVTRYSVSVQKQDSWDAAARSIWMLSLPFYLCALMLIPIGKQLLDALYEQRPIGASYTWSSVAVDDAVV